MIIGAICIAAAVVLYVLHPIITGQQASLQREDDEPTEAEARKRIALLGLRDVEYDHATGKLDEDDYRSLRDQLTVEAIEALEAMAGDPERPLTRAADPASGPRPGPQQEHALEEDPLEREIAAFRAALRREPQDGADCPACAGRNGPDSRFCAHCGSPLPAQPAGSTDRTGSSSE